MTAGKKIRTKEMILCAMFSALIAAGAFIKIPVPVVPFTLQFLFTNLAGLLLGRRTAAASVGVYILLGLAGLPVFADGGGIGYIVRPSFGYLLGFLAGAWVAAYIVERRGKRTVQTLLLAGFVNLAVVYLIGMLYYAFVSDFYLGTPIGFWPLLLYCFILAVPGDIVLCAAASWMGKRLYPLINMEGR